jgi:ATP-binding cassette subfamily G (WHITE) protein 2
MGPSGAGKSTLLDMLAQRKATGRLGGVLLVDGAPAGPGFAGACSYVPQSDNFLPVMTALETLQFYAGVSLPPSWGAARAAARVEEALCEMGLSHARLTLVGGELPGGLLLRGLSGGERKRLSIAAGVLAAPSALFLDEPTTGLDAFAALTVGAGRRAPRNPCLVGGRRPGGALFVLGVDVGRCRLCPACAVHPLS